MRALTASVLVIYTALPLGVSLLGCGRTEPPRPRLVRVEVSDDRGSPLAGIPIELDGIRTTASREDGIASLSLSADGPARARVAVVCPPSFRRLEARHIARPRSGAAPPLELAFRCLPRVRTLLVVARVRGGEGLVLRADGDAIGTVGADGTLHALLARAPGTEVRLVLDTGERALTPRNPARELRIADRDELVVFDQQLTPIRSRVARATVAAPSPPLPYGTAPDR